jgi:hypothetical protein
MGPSFAASKSSQASSQTTVSTAGSSSPATSGNNSPVNTGAGSVLTVGGNYDATPSVLLAALNSVSGIVESAISSVSSNNDANTAGQAALLSQVLGAAQAQSANTSSGGQTEQNKTVTYVVIGAFAFLAAIMIFRKN